MKKFIVIIMAVLVTATAVTMSAASALDRGGTAEDQELMSAMFVLICAGSHMILAVSRRKEAWVLWGCCLLGTLYGHVTFLTYASVRAENNRAQHSDQVVSVERQIEAVRDTIGSIRARPVTTIATELAAVKGWRKRQALEAELNEARRAATLRDELVTLSRTASVTRVAGATDLVITRIAAVTGSNESSVALLAFLCFAILLELLGAFFWYELLRGREEVQALGSRSHAQNVDLQELRMAVEAGKIRPTVREIRSFLGCGQAIAINVRRTFKRN